MIYYIDQYLVFKEIVEKIEENPIEAWSYFISKDIFSIVYDEVNQYQDLIKQQYYMRVTKPITTTYYRPEEIKTDHNFEHCVGEKCRVFIERRDFRCNEEYTMHGVCDCCSTVVSYDMKNNEIHDGLFKIIQTLFDVNNQRRADEVVYKKIYNIDFKIPKKFLEIAEKKASLKFHGFVV